MKKLIPFSFLLFMFTSATLSASSLSPDRVDDLLKNSTSADPLIADEAILELRTIGQTALDAFVEKFKPGLEKGTYQENRMLLDIMDRIAGQHDSYFSGLFWHTDLPSAIQTASESKKPILSLRLLGKLTDEYSCANSRLFRSLLYSNTEISSYLHDNYVLHWSSERPVPVVTIDYGDGRIMKTTLTGNSIHYIFTPAGTLVEAIPGLHSPDYFLSSLQRTDVFIADLINSGPDQQPAMIRLYHTGQLAGLRDLASKQQFPVAGRAVETRSVALLAERRTFSKMSIELPVMEKTGLVEASPETGSAEQILLVSEDNRYRAMSAELGAGGEIDLSSRRMAVAKNPIRFGSETELQKVLSKLSDRLCMETAKNETEIHGYIHLWFSNGEFADWEKVNDRIYSELFLTPQSDKWLGLYGEDVFTALDQDGIQ